MDFTLSAYKQLISTLQAQGFFFQTFEEFVQNPKEKVLILRHDVDRLPGNALRVARMENEAGLKASYYYGPWVKELVAQHVKNVIKRTIGILA